MSRLIAGFVILLGLAPLLAQAVPNTADNRPAATLLLPYFEVGPIANFPEGGAAAGVTSPTTALTVGNSDATAVLARVTVWTDFGIPTLSFHLYLTGFDIEAIDLRELFDGVLPRSADDGDDPQDAISRQGALSQDIAYPGCTGVFNASRPPPADIIGLRNAHVGLASSLFGNLCGARNHGDGILRGYITIDAVNGCDDTLLPNDAAYATLLASQNQLWGSYSITDGSNNFATRQPLVHIEAVPAPAAGASFYRRFNGDTGREGLGAIWSARYLNGGAFTASATLRVWREPRGLPAPVGCGAPAPAFLPGGQTALQVFDEQENVFTLVPGIDNAVSAANPFGLVSQAVNAAAPSLSLPFDFGWLYLNLNYASGANPSNIAQSHVGTVQQAAGRFAVSADGAMLLHPADIQQDGDNGSLGEVGGFPRGVSLQATKTVAAGPFTPGSTVTYTVVITNQGPRAQPDGTGDEFRDPLPGTLTLVSASADSGTATTSGNTVFWNGPIAVNQSVTITIQATVNSDVLPGTTIGNQGTATADTDLNGSNDTGTLTDDPTLPGGADRTSFTTPRFVTLQATKSVTGTFAINGAITYTVTITNQGPRAQPDHAGNEFTDTLPLGLTLVSASADSGTVATDIPNRLVTWNGPIAVNQRITLTIQATINADQGGRPLSNFGTAFADADQTPDGVNESQFRTNFASFTVAPLVQVQATKTVTGQFTAGGTVTYTVTLTNQGPQTQPDNATEEFFDFMPDGLTLVSATADSGAATADVPSNTVTWNGPIAANASVTLTTTATVRPGQFGVPISNQGFAYIDRNLDGINESPAIPTDDPGLPGTADPTTFVGQ